jgi:hypothetical protein
MEFTNPWEKGGKMIDSRVLRNISTELKFNKAQQQSNVTSESIARSAENLAANEMIVSTYRKFESQTTDWVFIRNSKISGAIGKGFESLKTWNGFKGLNTQRKQVLLDLAGLDDSNYSENSTTLSQLISAAAKWNKSYYAYFVRDQNGSDLGLCNVFVGEAIFGAGKNTITNGRYPAAALIHENGASYTKVNPENAQRGTIVTMLNGHHVEIITQIKDHTFADKGFCSIGAGRGLVEQTCVEKCDTAFTVEDTREIDNAENAFHRI